MLISLTFYVINRLVTRYRVIYSHYLRNFSLSFSQTRSVNSDMPK